MWPIEIPDGNLMCYHAAEALVRKPAVEMESRRLYLERRLAQLGQIEIDRMIWRWTNRGRDASEHRQGGAMNMARGDQPQARVASDDGCKFARIT